MRKQITMPVKLANLVTRYSVYFGVSESAVISFAITCLNHKFNSYNGLTLPLIREVDYFYKNYYIKELPRGKKAKEKEVQDNAKTKKKRSEERKKTS